MILRHIVVLILLMSLTYILGHYSTAYLLKKFHYTSATRDLRLRCTTSDYLRISFTYILLSFKLTRAIITQSDYQYHSLGRWLVTIRIPCAIATSTLYRGSCRVLILDSQLPTIPPLALTLSFDTQTLHSPIAYIWRIFSNSTGSGRFRPTAQGTEVVSLSMQQMRYGYVEYPPFSEIRALISNADVSITDKQFISLQLGLDRVTQPRLPYRLSLVIQQVMDSMEGNYPDLPQLLAVT